MAASKSPNVDLTNSTGERPTELTWGCQSWMVQCSDPRDFHSARSALSDACRAHQLKSSESYCFISVQSVDSAGAQVRVATIPLWSDGPICIKRLSVPKEIPLDYVYATEDQKEATLQSYDFFLDWLGAKTSAFGSPALLVIKLDPDCLWFLRFPISSYIRFRFGAFGQYVGVQWVVTDRSFVTTVSNRVELVTGLSRAESLLEGTLVIINTYKSHLQSKTGDQLQEALSILKQLINAVQNVSIGAKVLSLRTLFNPSAEELSRGLLDGRTRFVFAAFEAGAGVWELSDSQSTADCKGGLEFDLSTLENRLLHIQLMRIFHCNSVFRPTEDSEPATEHTLAAQLLRTGAQFVEGGITEESYFDFVFAVCQLLFKTALRVVLEARQLEGKIDINVLVQRCNQLLSHQGYEPALAGV
jgi:hypothetical protein